jgi:hypothetical protein
VVSRLSLIVSGADTHDSKKIGALPDERVARPNDKTTTENRKLISRYEKTDLSYCALLDLAAAMIILNKINDYLRIST